MCDYTQREYHCGCFRWIVSKWCQVYTTTHQRCQPNVAYLEYKNDEECGDCKPKPLVPWENMIKRSNKGGERWLEKDTVM
ncbi:hypothetical protein B0H66DRAFT_486202 [Apodospora peruviana]|uniref:Uncharacterized protein n=1 Tax=Apodospora peruviana TaxID=516989 RepID=A0AAE0HV10_9PEZI|nr:hypothetical protein B0H66DRAFT_486202 [Apodospora peruviana]